MKKLPLPPSIQELWTVWREIEGNAIRPCLINLISAPGEYADRFTKSLLQDSAYSELVSLVEPTAEDGKGADLNILLLDGETSSEAFPVARTMPRENLVAILIGVQSHLAVTCQREVMQAFDLRAEQVLLMPSPDEVVTLAKRLFNLFPDLTIPMARQFPIFRDAAAWEEVEATSKQNAVVGLIPIPGGDMPVMIANQLKMILRIAAMYDLPMTKDRIKEILAVVGIGFGFRTTARQLVKFIPGPGWIVGGSIGYTGTLAMGKAAIEYFVRVTK